MLDEPLDGRLSAGFAKIRLPEPVELDEGQRYSVCFTITDQDDNAFFNVEGYAESGSYIIDPVAGPGESYAYENGVWTDTGATEGIDMPIVVYTEDHVDGGLPALIVIVAAATVVTALALSRRD